MPIIKEKIKELTKELMLIPLSELYYIAPNKTCVKYARKINRWVQPTAHLNELHELVETEESKYSSGWKNKKINRRIKRLIKIKNVIYDRKDKTCLAPWHGRINGRKWESL